MKRAILALLVAWALLTGGVAQAERSLYRVTEKDSMNGVLYDVIPGSVILSDRVDGRIHVEARVVVRNLREYAVNFDESGFLVGHSPSTGESVVIEGFTARPAVAAPDGYSLLTFSDDVEMDNLDDWEFRPFFNLGDTQKSPVFVGVGDAVLEPYVGSDAIRVSRDLEDLPVGIYQCIVILGDADHRFLWAEDVTINTEFETRVSAGIEDYEVALFRKYGKEPTYGEIVVQAKD